MADDEQIIIIKKKGGHAGHHGGAWKVAYADFVTAMMALFIVLWLMNSSKPVQEAVGGYFRDPNGTAAKTGSAMGGSGEGAPAKKTEDMSKLKEELVKSLQRTTNFDKIKSQVELTVTPEGLQIELLEDKKGTFFENGNAHPTQAVEDILKVLASEAGKLPNPISIEGHTDSTQYSNSTTYGNWELSTDRANIARRLMEGSGLRPDQVTQVRGFADHKLRKPLQPTDASNRRITVIIQYMPKSEGLTPFVFDGSTPPTDLKTASVPAAAAPAAPAAKESTSKPPEAAAKKPKAGE
jgi:chemotaxis protein MotB